MEMSKSFTLRASTLNFSTGFMPPATWRVNGCTEPLKKSNTTWGDNLGTLGTPSESFTGPLVVRDSPTLK